LPCRHGLRRGFTTQTPVIRIGSVLEWSRVVGAHDVSKFACVSQDHNPLHVDEAAAASGPFKKPVAHGMLTATMFSALLGNTFPGAIYLSQSLRFTKPVFVGDTVTARTEVTAIRNEKRIIKFKTQAFRGDGEVVVTGEAQMLAPTDAVIEAP